MALTDSLDKVTQAIVDLLEHEDSELGLKDVWYGDEQLIPRTPCASVDPETKNRELYQTGHMTINTFSIMITLYHADLGSTNVTRKDCIILAENTEKVLHVDRTLGGILVHSYVTAVEPGFAQRGNSVKVATRLQWEGMNRTRIGDN